MKQINYSPVGIKSSTVRGFLAPNHWQWQCYPGHQALTASTAALIPNDAGSIACHCRAHIFTACRWSAGEDHAIIPGIDNVMIAPPLHPPSVDVVQKKWKAPSLVRGAGTPHAPRWVCGGWEANLRLKSVHDMKKLFSNQYL